MSDKHVPKSPAEYLIDQIEKYRPVAKLLGAFDKNAKEQFQQVERQLGIIKNMMSNRDLFAQIYSPLGWVNYDFLSTDIVAKVLDMNVVDGEIELTNYHLNPDNMRFLGYRFCKRHFNPWEAMYERAVDRAGAEDYLSAIPLILSIIDGVCTTSTGKHPFSGGADKPVFDSQTSGPGGLSEGLAILGSTRRKLDTELICMPFRHGIVHGLNPNYGSPIVAGKAFNLLWAAIDYFDRCRDEVQRLEKATEEQKPIDMRELGKRIQRNSEIKNALNRWKARPVVSNIIMAASNNTTNLPLDSPEAFAGEYLSWLMTKNYGELAKGTVDYPNRPIGFRAGRLRNELKGISLIHWSITGVEDTSSAISQVTVKLEGTIDDKMYNTECEMRLMFADESYETVPRGISGGVWCVMPNFLSELWLLSLRMKEYKT
ncbi:hypothetical protein [Pantoea sp. USHLN256]|uniref:hypothetical protein n=1 Tax=Pantoea sp. USHLN256 TaxID=3081293 RepID=UPI003015F3D7